MTEPDDPDLSRSELTQLLNQLSIQDIELLEQILYAELFLSGEDMHFGRILSRLEEVLPSQFRNAAGAALFGYAITQLGADELEELVGNQEGQRLARMRKVLGPKLDRVFDATSEGPEDWRRLRYLPLTIHEPEGQEQHRIRVIITRNDETTIRLEANVGSIASFTRRLVERLGELPQDFLNELSEEQLQRLKGTLNDTMTKLEELSDRPAEERDVT